MSSPQPAPAGSAPPDRAAAGERAEGELKQALGVVDLVMLGAGAAMGVSIFSVLAPAAHLAGSGILIAVFIAAAPMAVFGVVYAFMGSVLPKSGASYEWPRTLIHPFVGFLVAWLRILGSVGVLITLSLVLVQYLSTVVPIPARRPAMFAVLLVIFLVNVRGVRVAARAQTLAMLALIAAFTVFVATGAPHVSLRLIGNPLAAGLPAILTAVPLMIPLFLGLETSTEVGEEVRDPRRAVPWALGLALGLTVVVYLAVAFTALGLLGPQSLASSAAPLIDAGRRSVGGLAAPLILGAAVLALLKSLNSIFIVFSRYLFAMARAGVFPAAMARIHPRWGTPHIAASGAFALTVLGLALPKDLVFLFVTVSIPTVLKYLSTCVSAWRLARTRPELVAGAYLPLGVQALSHLAALGAICALVIFGLGVTTDWRPYMLVGVWGAVGVLYWLLAGRALA